MSKTITTEKPRRTRAEAIADLRRLRAEIADANPDLTDEDWDALPDRWAADVNAALANHVRGSRGEFGALRQNAGSSSTRRSGPFPQVSSEGRDARR